MDEAENITREAAKDAVRRQKDPVAMFTVTEAEKAVEEVGNPRDRALLRSGLADHAKEVRRGIDSGSSNYAFNVARARWFLDQARKAGR